MKKTLSIVLVLTVALSSFAVQPEKVKPVKNIILMITDGTSISTVSAARWLQVYRDPANTHLNIDPWLCAYVRTCNRGTVR